jgi:protein-S-isoprenylcysteine O-methyltransferase Ste14
MNTENIYRITALVLLLSAVSISITFRHRAAKSGEAIKSDAEGRLILMLRSVFGLLGWLGAFLYLINPAWMAWAQLPLPSWVRWMGAAILAICIPLVYWIFSSLGKNVTPTVVTRQAHTLVVHGPYHWVRHPLYTVGSLVFIGFSMLAANWFVFSMLAIAVVVLIMRTPIEEQHLINRFGDEYRQYMRRTGRYLPRIKSNSSPV